VQLACPDLDLRPFPYDTQILPIRLKARNHKSSHRGAGGFDSPVTLVGPEGATGAGPMDGLRRSGHTFDPRADRLSEWQLHSMMGIRSDPANRFYEIRIVVYRIPAHVLWYVCFPTMMVVSFSLCVYALPIAEVGNRLEITATCLLSLMAFQGTIKDMLPPMPYQTALGVYVVVAFSMLALHGIEHALAYVGTSGSSSEPWRSRPAEFFLGVIEPWDETSPEPVRIECILVYIEVFLLVVVHVLFRWQLTRARRKGEKQREQEAAKLGVSLVEGPLPLIVTSSGLQLPLLRRMEVAESSSDRQSTWSMWSKAT